MKIEEIINNINSYIDELDFVSARRLIEDNMELLKKYRSKLNSNARELMDILIQRQKDGFAPLTRSEMATIIAINSYSTNFDIRSLKLILKDKAGLLLKQEAIQYLSSDAKVILEGMGVINKE